MHCESKEFCIKTWHNLTQPGLESLNPESSLLSLDHLISHSDIVAYQEFINNPYHFDNKKTATLK